MSSELAVLRRQILADWRRLRERKEGKRRGRVGEWKGNEAGAVRPRGKVGKGRSEQFQIPEEGHGWGKKINLTRGTGASDREKRKKKHNGSG
jgi:hypothetical protein